MSNDTASGEPPQDARTSVEQTQRLQEDNKQEKNVAPEKASIQIAQQKQDRAEKTDSSMATHQGSTDEEETYEQMKNQSASEHGRTATDPASLANNGRRINVWVVAIVVLSVGFVLILEKITPLIQEKGLEAFMDAAGGSIGCLALSAGFFGHALLDGKDPNNTTYGLDLAVGFFSLIGAACQLWALFHGL